MNQMLKDNVYLYFYYILFLFNVIRIRIALLQARNFPFILLSVFKKQRSLQKYPRILCEFMR